jgi:hypothetical protein
MASISPEVPHPPLASTMERTDRERHAHALAHAQPLTNVECDARKVRGSWSNPLVDCCGEPGRYGICAYVLFCPPCAAAMIAKHAGREPVFSFLAYLLCGWWLAEDRRHLASLYNIDDDLEGPVALICMSCGCSCCLLIQQLNEISRREAEIGAGIVDRGTGKV